MDLEGILCLEIAADVCAESIEMDFSIYDFQLQERMDDLERKGVSIDE